MKTRVFTSEKGEMKLEVKETPNSYKGCEFHAAMFARKAGVAEWTPRDGKHFPTAEAAEAYLEKYVSTAVNGGMTEEKECA